MLARMFLKYWFLCCVLEKNGIESAIQRGYVYIWNCSLIVQKAYSSSTRLTRLKIQINTQITKNLTTKSLTPKIIKNHSVLLFDKLPCPSHFQINKNNLKNPLYQNPKIHIHNTLSDKLQHTLRSLSCLKHNLTLSTQTPLKSNHRAWYKYHKNNIIISHLQSSPNQKYSLFTSDHTSNAPKINTNPKSLKHR